MIIGDRTTDGTLISDLKFNSRKKIIRRCDNCKSETEAVWNDILRCRKKQNRIEDYCFTCSMKIYNTDENNSSKKTENKLKISLSTKGKSKTFKDNKDNKDNRILNRKLTNNGYIMIWDDSLKKHVLEHKMIISKLKNKPLNEVSDIHHINGVKTNNELSNLEELTTSQHSSLHAQLQNVAFELVRDGVIIYDKINKRYNKSPLINIKTLEQSLGFENIAIKQKKNICSSRLDVNIRSEFVRGIYLDVPLVASNMSTVVNSSFCIQLRKLGAIGIMHRALNENDYINEIKLIAKDCDLVAASIGVGDDQFKLCKKLILAGANIICIDVAHGYSDYVLELAKKIKKQYSDVKLIIGNTTNTNIILETYEYVDAIKVGIAQGFACETKNTAGCTEKQFSAVHKFKYLSKNFGIPIISDGGIREPADFTKSIAAGANSIMAGKIFAECPESAAEIVNINDVPKKLYAGMASQYVQEKWKGGLKSGTCAEGGIRYLDIGESLNFLIEKYSGALKSGITYAGGKDILTFQNNVEFVRI